MTNGESPERFHPHYRELHAELLARPYPVVSGQVIVSHRAIHYLPGEAAAHRSAVEALATHEEVVATPVEQGILLLKYGAVELRIEPHAEFTTFTVFAPQVGAPFSGTAMEGLPEGLLDGIPGRVFAAVEIASELVANGDSGTAKTMERVSEYFGQERVVGGWVIERMASVWSHFHLDDQGATRILVQIHRLTSGRYGRLIQRLLEIETCRMAAMLNLPLAREVLDGVRAMDARRVRLVGRIDELEAGDEGVLLSELTNLTLAGERLNERCGSSFILTKKYARVLSERVRELREEPVPGYQTFEAFFAPRLSDAWDICESAETGLRGLSQDLQATTQLLKTVVEVSRKNELGVVREEASVPLLTNPVETPPPHWHRYVDVILWILLTYCLANLLKLMIEGIRVIGIPLNASLVTALALPFLAYGVWRGIQYAKTDPDEQE